jgi:hypothetical protein
MTRYTMKGPDDPRHGTVKGYNNLNCRCPACTEAWRVRHREYMHANPARMEKAREREAFRRLQQGRIPRDQTRGPRWPLCDVDGCQKKAKSLGWCPTHYSRWRRNGDPLAVRPNVRAPGVDQKIVRAAAERARRRAYGALARRHFAEYEDIRAALEAEGITDDRRARAALAQEHPEEWTAIREAEFERERERNFQVPAEHTKFQTRLRAKNTDKPQKAVA